MAREGTRSATGNSKPRVFDTVDTAPAIKRTTKPKVTKKPATETTAVASKPAGVTKKAPAKKNGVAAKVSQTPVLRLQTCPSTIAVSLPGVGLTGILSRVTNCSQPFTL